MNQQTIKTNQRSWLKIILVSLLVLVLAIVTSAYWLLYSSLPQLEGELVFSELSEAVSINRDQQGLVTITSKSREASAFALGFVHAQERFFQMDLLRRRGAGELSELFGKVALETDKSARVHRFRARTKRFIEDLPVEYKRLFDRYTKGVNAGLESLGSQPFEYYFLQSKPTAWKMEDSLLVSYAMYFALQSDHGRLEWQQYLLEQSLPEELTKFLLPTRSFWDAPVEVESEPWKQAVLPNKHKEVAALDKRQHARNLMAMETTLKQEESSNFGLIGSNNWAVAGAMTSHGAAMMADDMHLGLNVPNTWFRVRLSNPDSNIDLNGVSLPGGPMVIAGSNGYVAWGFTNSYGDWGDLIRLKMNPDNTMEYLSGDSYKAFTVHRETINVKGEEAFQMDVKDTVWGPVVKGESDEPMVYKWVAHYPEGMNAGLFAMEKVKTVDGTLTILDQIGMPAQNGIIADRFGNIAWTIFGAVPKRHYSDAKSSDESTKANAKKNAQNYLRPMDWSDGSHGWDGWLSSNQYPRVKNPQNYRLWSANSRVVSGENLFKVGDGHYVLGARAKQIRDDLFILESPIKEQQLLDIQLDDRAIFLTRWQQFLLKVITESSEEKLQLFKEKIENWGARAAVDSIGYRLVKEYRLKVARTLFASITAPCKAKFSECNYYRATHLWEEPLWTLVTTQDPDWLPEVYADWKIFLEQMALESFQPILDGKQTLASYTWGNKNQINIGHPMSKFIPGLAKLTDMPVVSYSGDRDMPKAATSRFGASERMVITPGHEEDAILHMPTSQSGHPLSPYYGVGHEDWVEGKATPLLPGETKWELRLIPEK